MHKPSDRAACKRRSRWALLLLLAGLGGCASEDAESNHRESYLPPSDWFNGGQTGSLMPRCGVPEAALERGVPESAQGIVIYTSECAGGVDLSELSVRGPNGERVDVQVTPIGDGAVLITFTQAPTPGSYSIGGATPSPDAGLEDDAGAIEDDAGASPPAIDSVPSELDGMSQSVSIGPAMPAPAALGSLHQREGSCNAVFSLTLDATMLPHVGSLRLELLLDGQRVDWGVPYGSVQVTDAVVTVGVPQLALDALLPGDHVLTVRGEVAGLDAVFESSPVTVHEPCVSQASRSGGYSGAESCSAGNVGNARGSSGWPWSFALLVLAWAHTRKRKRKRRSRPRAPDPPT